jgi:hypothetical protein
MEKLEWSERKFHAHFGVSQFTILVLFQLLHSHFGNYFSLDHILWAFYFLKVYTSVDVGAEYWKISSKTYELWIWRTLHALFIVLDMVNFGDFLNL